MKRALSVAMIAGLLLAACGGAGSPAGGPPAADQGPCGPKGSGALTILGTPQEEYIQGMARAFESECGIRTSYVRLSSGEALARLRADRGAPQFSVWWGGPADGFIAAHKEGVLEPYKPKGFDKIPAQYKDPAGVWTGVYVGALGLAVNEKVLRERNIPEPKSWADLLDPRFRGQISMAHPGSSGTSYTMVATQMFLSDRNIDRGMDYMRRLHPNILQYTKSGAAPARQAGQGEVAVGIVFSHDTVAAAEAGFRDLKVVFPSEGTGYEVGGMALIKGGADPVAAKTFMDWAIGVKAQELGPQFKAYQIPTNPDAKVSEKSVKLAQVKTVPYDFQWAGDNRRAIVERFSNEVAPQPR